MTSILAFFLLICILVFVHEYGHFWAARKCGVKIIRFSIGFGKVLFKRTDKYGTEFAFSLIPLGGYVQMYNGEDNINAMPHEAINNKSVLQRAFIISAGPFANFIFAVFAYWAVFASGFPTVKPVIGEVLPNTIAAQAKLLPELEITQVNSQHVQDWEETALALIGNVGKNNIKIKGRLIDESIEQEYQLDLTHWIVDNTKENPLTSLGIHPKTATVKPNIKQVLEDSPAAKAGILANDKILSVNNENFNWNSLIETVQTGEVLHLEIERSGQIESVTITPEKQDKRYIIGLVPDYEPLADKYRTELKYDILPALSKSFHKVASLIKTIIQFIGNLITGELSLKNMSGPISMAKGAGSTAEIGWIYYLSFMALISVNLGVMNLFPILPLDGGQLILLSLEAIRGKALSEKVQFRFQQLGMAFVLTLMLFAFINDVIHF